MEIDPLNSNKISLYQPSFPLFNFDLLKKGDFDFYIPDLIPLEKISDMIQSKMQQKINLNGDFELFEKKEKKKYSSFQRKNQTKVRKTTKESGMVSASKIKKSNFMALSLKRTGRRAVEVTPVSKYNLDQSFSPNKKSREPLKNKVEEPYAFPSLASILEGDEESSTDETTFSLGGFGSSQGKNETDQKSELAFQFDLFRDNSHQDFLPEENQNFEKTLDPFGCDVSIFTALFSETTQSQNRKNWNKKVKENPRVIDENFQSFNLFGNIGGNNKLGSFGLTLEKTQSSNSFDVPLEVQLEENVALGLNNNIVLTK